MLLVRIMIICAFLEHYWYRTTIFADVMATCDAIGKCVVRNDASLRPFTGTVTVTLTSFATGEQTQLARQHVSLPAGVGATKWFQLGSSRGNSSHHTPPPPTKKPTTYPNFSFLCACRRIELVSGSV